MQIKSIEMAAGNDDLNDDDYLGEDEPPLHAAAEDNDVSTARRLLRRQPRVDPNAFWDSETPLHICCRLGHTELAEVLIDHGANCNYITEYRHESPLYLASREGHDDLVKLLVEKGSCIEGNKDCGLEAIYCAAVYGCVKVFRYLVQQGVPFEEYHMPHGHTPLTCACRHGRKGIVEELVSVGADVNKPMNNGHSGVFLATMFQYSNIVKLLVKAGAELDGYSIQFQACPLHIACSNDDVDTLNALLLGNCDVNVIQDAGQTPLYVASELGFLNIVDTLIAKGANPDIDTLDTGNTPLFACLDKPLVSEYINANKPTLELVHHLVAAGCDVDHENNSSVTPLQAALDRQNCEAAMALLSADCRYSWTLRLTFVCNHFQENWCFELNCYI